MLAITFLVLLVVGYLVFRGAKQGLLEGNALTSIRSKILSKYPGAEICFSLFGRSLLAISFDSEKVVLATLSSEDEFDFAQLAEIEIVENGTTLIQTNRGSQLLTAAVGGLAFGGVGALAGSLTGTKQSQTRLNELLLKLTVDDNAQPIRKFLLLNAADKKGLDPSSALVREKREEAERLHALLSKAMRQAQRRVQAAPSISDGIAELHKLFEMHKSGALSEAEFNTLKASVLKHASAKSVQ